MRFVARYVLAALLAVALLTSAPACTSHPETPTAKPGELSIRADVAADPAHPAEMQLAIKKGSLRIVPATANAPSLEGIARSPDPTLLPHVSTNRRGIAVIQDFDPDDAKPVVAWDLRLGSTPLRFFLHVVSSEEQHVDLGGRSLVTARLYNEGGHLDLDWSAPSAIVSERIELWSIGYLEAHHLARSRAKHVEIKNVGNAEIDLGDRVDADLAIDVAASAGNLSLTIPSGISARAIFDAQPAVRIDASGFTRDADGAFVRASERSTARVAVTVHASSGNVTLR